MNTFSIAEALGAGWEAFKRNIGVFIVLVVATVATNIGFSFLGGAVDGQTPLVIAVAVVSMLIQAYLGAMLMKAAILALSAERVMLPSLVVGGREFVFYFLCYVLVALATMIGMLLLVLPGIFLSIKFMFAVVHVLATGSNPVDGMKASWNITRGQWWPLFGFTLLLLVVNILGILALGLGLLVTVPMSISALVHVYQGLSGATAEPGVSGAPSLA